MKKSIVYLQIIIFMTSIISCKNNIKTQEEEKKSNAIQTITLTKEELGNTKIQMGKVTFRNMSNVIKVTGSIDVPPQNMLSITTPMGGVIRNTSLLQGSHVHKGDILAEIENADFIKLQEDYLETKTKIALLTTEYERQKELNKENVSAVKILQQASTNLKNAKNNLNAQEEKLKLIGISPVSVQEGEIQSKIFIKSLISGYVTTVNVNIGKNVTPNDVLFEIVDTKHVHAELSVYEKDIMNIKKGQKVRIKLSNNPTKEYLGEVLLINHKIETDRTVRVHVHFKEEHTNLLPNMYLTAEIESENAEVTVVPNDAITTMNSKFYVFVAEKGTQNESVFSMVEIQKANSDKEFTAVILPENFDFKNAEIVIHDAYSLQAKLMNVGE